MQKKYQHYKEKFKTLNPITCNITAFFTKTASGCSWEPLLQTIFKHSEKHVWPTNYNVGIINTTEV